MREVISKAINTDHLSSNKQLKGLFQDGVEFVNDTNQHTHSYNPTQATRLLEQLGYKMIGATLKKWTRPFFKISATN